MGNTGNRSKMLWALAIVVIIMAIALTVSDCEAQEPICQAGWAMSSPIPNESGQYPSGTLRMWMNKKLWTRRCTYNLDTSQIWVAWSANRTYALTVSSATDTHCNDPETWIHWICEGTQNDIDYG